MTQLPAYLQSANAKKINENALLGIGGSLPPHISIRGNSFTLVDAAGSTQPAGAVLDVNIADISDVMCKQYYSEKWTPDSNEPPACWSANGVAPSREAIEPQSATCADCRHNVRGSTVSAISGAAIKACRDEKWLAVLIPSIPNVQFQLKLTPGSFKTWQAYVKTAEGSQTQISDVLTRLAFQPGVNGVLTFQAVSYIDENTAAMRNLGYEKKSFDMLVGRNDRPIQAALAAPGAAALPNPAAIAVSMPVAAGVLQPAPFQPAPQPALAAGAQAGFAQPTPATASPSEQAPQPRRRRTKAEMEAANIQAPQGQPAQMAPFRPQTTQPAAPAFGAPAAAPAGNGASFGIQQGVAPNPELAQALTSLFGPKT